MTLEMYYHSVFVSSPSLWVSAVYWGKSVLRLSPVFDYIHSWTGGKYLYIAFFGKNTEAGGKLDIGVRLITTAVKDS